MLREIGEKLGFSREQVKGFFKRERKNVRKHAVGIALKRKSLAHRKEVRTSLKYMVIYQHKEKYSVHSPSVFFLLIFSYIHDIIKTETEV